MMNFKNIAKLLQISVFIIIIIPKVKGIKCFQCNSNNNSACLNLELTRRNPLYPTLCEGDFGENEPFCRKIVLDLLEHNKKIESRIIRSCGWVRYKKSCYNADNDDHNERVCQCFEDGCNMAATKFLTKNMFLFILPIMLAFCESLLCNIIYS